MWNQNAKAEAANKPKTQLPRMRPRRTGRALPEVEAGSCYLCGAPAAHPCRQCHRPICHEHLVPFAEDLQPIFGLDACQACVRDSAEDLARDESQWARKRAHDLIYRICGVCGRKFEQALSQCSQCQRPVCPEHSVRYRRRFKFGAQGGDEEAWYWDYEVRCHDHRLKPIVARIRGWEVAPWTSSQALPDDERSA